MPEHGYTCDRAGKQLSVPPKTLATRYEKKAANFAAFIWLAASLAEAT